VTATTIQFNPALERLLDIQPLPKGEGIPKPHVSEAPPQEALGFCFIAVAFTDLLCSGLTLAPQTDTASPAALCVEISKKKS